MVWLAILGVVLVFIGGMLVLNDKAPSLVVRVGYALTIVGGSLFVVSFATGLAAR